MTILLCRDTTESHNDFVQQGSHKEEDIGCDGKNGINLMPNEVTNNQQIMIPGLNIKCYFIWFLILLLLL